MKYLFPLLFVSFVFLYGCGDTFSEIKDAVGGINSKANEAAIALSPQVLELRELPIMMQQDEHISINTLFKNTLRDLQWTHEKQDEYDVLLINGTWQDPLFQDAIFTEQEKVELEKNGEVFVKLYFETLQFVPLKTEVKLIHNEQEILKQFGQQALDSFIESYLK